MNTAKMCVLRARRNEAATWGIDLLDVLPGDRVLAIGLDCEAREYLSRRIVWGRIVPTHGIEATPGVPLDFDRAIAVDAARVWEDPVGALRKLRDRLRPGGHVAVALDLRGVSEKNVRRRGLDLLVALTQAGFADAYVEVRDSFTGAAVCALGTS